MVIVQVRATIGQLSNLFIFSLLSGDNIPADLLDTRTVRMAQCRINKPLVLGAGYTEISNSD